MWNTQKSYLYHSQFFISTSTLFNKLLHKGNTCINIYGTDRMQRHEYMQVRVNQLARICPRVQVIHFSFERSYYVAVAASFKSLLKRPECKVKPEALCKLESIVSESPDCLISHHVRYRKLYLVHPATPGTLITSLKN